MASGPTLDPAELEAFRAVAAAENLDPSDRWVGGYVDYEWAHLRRVLRAYGIDLAGKRAFELGCNIGASSVVMAKLGAAVEAVDIDARFTRVARANVALHHVAEHVRVTHVDDTTALPLRSGSFDFVLANSVLEYVPAPQRGAVLAELHRILRPGGLMLICGTSNRLSPREVHSGKWLVNYLPRGWFERGDSEPERGIAPWQLLATTRGGFSVVGQDRWLEARRAIHGKPSWPMRALDMGARLAGLAPGLLAPNIELLLRKS